MGNLWGGRFEKGMDKLVEEFNASITFDIELYKHDIMGSIAHVTMLASEGLVTPEERDQIVNGLKIIQTKIENGELTFTYKNEDIHMAVEGELIKAVGDVGRKLHTARSRNDQTVLDTRMYLRDQIIEIFQLLKDFENTILLKAYENKEKLMPGFTHLQHAQPVTIGFHLMAYFQQFKRDMERLKGCYERLDYCPLGACALAGTTLPINRQMTAKLLGFGNVSENAMDTVADRDFIVDFISFASLCMAHLSRFSEEYILWNSQEFSFIDIDDSFCTGSSIMPQKKNPDIPELIRGKTGRVYGNLMGILTVIKGLPMAFNKDFQEDKEGLFDTIKTVKTSIKIFDAMLEKTEFNYEKIEKQMVKGFLNATDVAETFVNQGIPFRTAHELVGAMVKYCEQKGIQLEEIKKTELSLIDERLEGIDLGALDNYSCVLKRVSFGGTAPSEVERQINTAREFLKIELF